MLIAAVEERYRDAGMYFLSNSTAIIFLLCYASLLKTMSSTLARAASAF